MAWPKKGTRKLVIDQAEWLYHYDAHCEFCSSDCVTIGQLGQPHYLFLDTFSRYFDNTPRLHPVGDCKRMVTSYGA